MLNKLENKKPNDNFKKDKPSASIDSRVINDDQQNDQTDNEDYENESSNSDGPRFSIVEAFFLIAFNVCADLLELLDMSGVGAIVGFVVDWIIAPITIFWLWIKGIKMISKNSTAQALEFLPFLDILPIRTTMIIFTIIKTNYPNKLNKLGDVGKIIKKVS